MIKTIDYDAFGNILNDTNPLFEIPFGFAGGLHDRDTGIVRFGFRDYDPDVGRWTAKDPIGYDGGDVNLYSYALNNPNTYVDPTGEVVLPSVIVGLGIFLLGDLLHPQTMGSPQRDAFVEEAIPDLALAPLGMGVKGCSLASRGIGSGIRAFGIAPRVMNQFKNARLGNLTGKLTPEKLNELVNNPAASRFIDARSGHINVIQEAEGTLLRITVQRDALRIISVGPIRARNVRNLVSRGAFVPLP